MSKGGHMSTERQYELVYITPPDASEEALADLHTQVGSIIEKFGGRIERSEPWGRRRLAYEINHQREGNYVMELLVGPGAMTAELDRRLRNLDMVMRHLIVRVDEDLAIAERAKAHRKAFSTRRRLKRGLPAEPTVDEKRRHGGDDDDSDAGGGDMGFGGGGER